MEKLTDKISFDSGIEGYNIRHNDEFIIWLNDCIDNNYEVIINIDDIQKTIDMISDWYLKKYSKCNIKNNVHCSNDEFNELLKNLPPKALELISCHYRYKNMATRKLLLGDELINTKQFDFFIESEFNKYFFYALSDTGRIISTNFPNVNNKMTVDHLYLIFSNIDLYKNYNTSAVDKIVYNHIIDLELRDIIFNLITLRMSVLGKGGSTCRNYRFNKMLHDFEYNIDNINLSEDIIDNVEEITSANKSISFIKKINLQFKKKTSNM
ncbi:MAG: hypothetical protein PHQ64_04205 [Bacilli bacterium]|nr:hypothetical protein [Bacilli bacterium]